MDEVYWQQLHAFRIANNLDNVVRTELFSTLTINTGQNYCHCLESCPTAESLEMRHQVAALTGSSPSQCDSVAIIDLGKTTRMPSQGEFGTPEQLTVDLKSRVLLDRAVLSVCWSKNGRLLLLNTRPRVDVGRVQTPQSGLLEVQPAPPLSTWIELVVLDASTLEMLSVHGGHHAFTTAEAPFILHADSWADADLISSGGEDRCVHVWHRRHERRLKRLEGHNQVVNAVSWSPALRLLASASDDQTVILWA